MKAYLTATLSFLAAITLAQDVTAPFTPSELEQRVVFTIAAGETNVADALQAFIEANPHKTIYLPDRVYLLSHPISTPADPDFAVSLELADFAILKAAPDYKYRQPLVRLGGIRPANNIRKAGSVYSFTGGVLDGSGRAAGIFIESGRETRVQNVSMKNVSLGLRIKYGANSGSSDCDIRDVHIVGNRADDSLGVWIEAYDNTLTNMRIADCRVGVRMRAGGNLLTNIHPLWTNPADQYDGGIGFDESSSNNSYIRCYADHFASGWRFRKGAGPVVMDGCICFWYAPSPGHPHTAIKCDGMFEAMVTGMQFGFKDKQATNTVLETGAEGGGGFIADPRLAEWTLNNPADAFRPYLRGTIHRYSGSQVTVPSLSAPAVESAASLFGVPPKREGTGNGERGTEDNRPTDNRPTVQPSNRQTLGETGNGEQGTGDNSQTVKPSNRQTASAWTFVSVKNGVCDDVCGAPCGDDDLSYHFRCMHDAGGLIVEVIVRDDDISTDTCPAGSIDCRSWLDDCAEVFIDGEMARLADSRANGGKHLWHGGEFVLVANGAAQSNSSAAPKGYIPPSQAFGGEVPDANWWTGEAFIVEGYGHAERFYIPWRSMGHKTVPSRIGFTISLQDDDNGGERDHTLYWTGNPAKPHLDERAFGVVVLE